MGEPLTDKALDDTNRKMNTGGNTQISYGDLNHIEDMSMTEHNCSIANAAATQEKLVRTPNTKPETFVEDTDGSSGTRTSASTWEILLALASVVSYLFDMGADINVIYQHFRAGNRAFGGLSLVFFLVPLIIVMAFNLAWYYDKYTQENRKWYCCPWVIPIMFTLLGLGQPYRYVAFIVYGIRGKSTSLISGRKYFFNKMQNHAKFFAFIKIIECYMEAAPQLMLQLYILLKEGGDENHWLFVSQIVTCVSSLVTIASCTVSYRRTMLPALTCAASIVQTVWQFMLIGARILAIVLFATQLRWWLALILSVHFLVMLLWLLWLKCYRKYKWQTEKMVFDFKSSHRFVNILLILTLSAVYVLHYVNFIEISAGPSAVARASGLRYIIYYAIVLVESIIMLTVWFVWTQNSSLWYGLFLGIILIFIGIIIQALYYALCHRHKGQIIISLINDVLERLNIRPEMGPERRLFIPEMRHGV